MSVDKFGRHSSKAFKTKLLRGIPGQGFTLTQSGDFNIENKRLCNVKNPTETQDASTKAYVDNTITKVLARNLKDVATKQYVQSELVSLKVIIKVIEEKINTLYGKKV